MTDIDTAAVEASLRAAQRDLRARLAGLTETPERGSGISFGKRIGDGTVEAVSRLTDIGVGRNLEAAELRVERALAKLADGTYGICDGCDRPIAPGRLDAFPESVLCVQCSSSAPRR